MADFMTGDHDAKAAHSGSGFHAPSFFALLSVMALILVLSGMSSALLWAPPAEDTFARIQRGAALRIGYAVEAPYAFVDNDQVTGEAPQIARFVARRLGVRNIEWRQYEFGSLIAALKAGRFDVMAAGMFITAERAGRIDFSLPTSRARQGLLVRAGNPLRLSSYEAAVSARVAVLTGSIEESFFASLAMDPRRLVRVPDPAIGRAALVGGLVDALALTVPTVNWMAAADPETEAAVLTEEPTQGVPDLGGHSAFAFRKGDHRLRDAWNEVLASFIGSPDHLELVGEFGFSREDLPEGVSGMEDGAWR